MIPDSAHRGPGAPAATLPHGGVTDARIAAADILADLRGGDLLDAAFDRRVQGLEARDRRWTQELVYGMLRRRGLIDALLAPRVRGGLVRLDADLVDVLRLGAYQLLHMRSVPPYAAIAQTVELAKQRHGMGASKLTNAVLRRVDRERDQLADLPNAEGYSAEALALRYSHPLWLVARWVDRWGEAEVERLLTWNNEEPPLIVRPFGVVREQLEASLEGSGVHVVEVPLVPDSLRIISPVALADLGAYRQGLFFVQDPGATLVTRYAAFPTASTVIDLCAAPGGKSVELARDASAVIACDRSLPRLARMRTNITRLDTDNIFLAAMDVRSPGLADADAVLLDAPCTGTGTFRRHPDARWRLKISDLAVMAAAQRSMLRAAAAIVKPGGILVYSTCSLEPEENDAQIESFLADSPEWTLEPPSHSVPEALLDEGRLRVLPQRHDVDGAFAARLRRAA
jgi:16S rRNA (cytosine967-C5)-methyltransferase